MKIVVEIKNYSFRFYKKPTSPMGIIKRNNEFIVVVEYDLVSSILWGTHTLTKTLISTTLYKILGKYNKKKKIPENTEYLYVEKIFKW